jgi:hypothetical protein
MRTDCVQQKQLRQVTLPAQGHRLCVFDFHIRKTDQANVRHSRLTRFLSQISLRDLRKLIATRTGIHPFHQGFAGLRIHLSAEASAKAASLENTLILVFDLVEERIPQGI